MGGGWAGAGAEEGAPVPLRGPLRAARPERPPGRPDLPPPLPAQMPPPGLLLLILALSAPPAGEAPPRPLPNSPPAPPAPRREGGSLGNGGGLSAQQQRRGAGYPAMQQVGPGRASMPGGSLSVRFSRPEIFPDGPQGVPGEFGYAASRWRREDPRGVRVWGEKGVFWACEERCPGPPNCSDGPRFPAPLSLSF